MSRILVLEDETVIRTALRRLLERHRYRVDEAATLAEARTALAKARADLLIADLRLPDGIGTDAIAMADGSPVLIMTSYASVRSAVESMQLGAADYIAKPFDHDEMLICVERLLKTDRLQRQNRALKSDVARSYPVTHMIGNCPAMVAVAARIGKAAPTDSTVLILGESGTGKELVARALHERSPRRDAPMITVNCASIPSGLIENELFGHEKGSFTGAVEASQGLVAAANAGTLFLDEIGELPMEAQARLLRVLQEGEVRPVGASRSRHVDIRLVAATHRDLPSLIDSGEFREDLYFRLNVIEISLPPLRERGDDIKELADMLLRKNCASLNRPRLEFHPSAVQAIGDYDWPGNVRELENAIERAVILCDGPAITPELLSIGATGSRRHSAERTLSVGLSLEEYFRRFVAENQTTLTETELAQRLGISRKTLWERRQRFGIPRPKTKP